MSNAVDDNSTIPLTATQKLRLAYRFVPVISFVVILIFSVTVLPDIIGQPIPPLLPVFLVIVLVVLAYQATKSLRDLLSGVALIEEDELVRLWHSRSEGNTRYGKFARLGRLRMTQQAFNQGHVGQHYRVCYSPASRMVWSLES